MLTAYAGTDLWGGVRSPMQYSSSMNYDASELLWLLRKDGCSTARRLLRSLPNSASLKVAAAGSKLLPPTALSKLLRNFRWP